MNNYDAWELYNAFLNQCTCDKKNLRSIYRRFREQVLQFGWRLTERATNWPYTIFNNNDMEFIDFIDGNGFILEQVQSNVYNVIPQYPETKTNNPKICTYKWE